MRGSTLKSSKSDFGCTKTKELRVINIGLPNFYNALVNQNVKVVQVLWRPPVMQTKEISDLLDLLL